MKCTQRQKYVLINKEKQVPAKKISIELFCNYYLRALIINEIEILASK